MPPSATTHHPAPALSNDASLLQGCEPGPRLRVAALLSGGVDSSVALALAQRAGHEVHAFYLQIWFQEDFRNTWASCPWEEDLEQCREVGSGWTRRVKLGRLCLPFGQPGGVQV